MRLRAEQEGDRHAIHDLVAGAFPADAEAKLVDQLRDAGDVAISLVAEDQGLIIGHVLFSHMTAPFRALGLAPVAVAQHWRRQGVAARLIETGLAEAKAAGWEAVFVLGEPDYYGRFGFGTALAEGFGSPYAGPHFMAHALDGTLPVREGRVDYAPAFAALG